MVKGIARRVIVIKSPDPQIFDEAIFIVKEDASKRGVTQGDILREAEAVAGHYVHMSLGHSPMRRLPRFALFLTGAGFTALLWLLTSIL